MIIEEIYEWAKSHDCLNLELKARDFYGNYQRVNSAALIIKDKALCINVTDDSNVADDDNAADDYQAYTYIDIISRPFVEEAKEFIGKYVYIADSPLECLNAANKNNTNYLHKLIGVDDLAPNPYCYQVNGRYVYKPYFIPKIDGPIEYVPFENFKEFLEAYEKHTKQLKPYGLWIKQKVEGEAFFRIKLITELFPRGVTVAEDGYIIIWGGLLKDFVFEDGSPCGKRVNIDPLEK